MDKRIFAIDIDGTLIKGQSQKYFIAFLRKKGLISFWAYAKIMCWFILYKLHLASNSGKILSFALANFKGKSVKAVSVTIEEFMATEIRPRYFKNSKALIEMLQRQGWTAVLLSSSVEIIVAAIAKDLHVADYICTKVETRDGVYTGEVIGTQVYGNQKVAYLEKFLKEKGAAVNEVAVVADHDSDIPLLKAAHFALVANPDGKMHTWAKENDVPVIYLDNDESIQYVESHIVS